MSNQRRTAERKCPKCKEVVDTQSPNKKVIAMSLYHRVCPMKFPAEKKGGSQNA